MNLTKERLETPFDAKVQATEFELSDEMLADVPSGDVYVEDKAGSHSPYVFRPQLSRPRQYITLVGDAFSASARSTERSVAERFRRLAQEWREATSHLSSVTAIAMHAAYQQIIGMGPRVVPFILQELEREPSQWFWALKAITGVDPVPEEGRGDLRVMTEAWIEWARNNIPRERSCLRAFSLAS